MTAWRLRWRSQAACCWWRCETSAGRAGSLLRRGVHGVGAGLRRINEIGVVVAMLSYDDRTPERLGITHRSAWFLAAERGRAQRAADMPPPARWPSHLWARGRPAGFRRAPGTRYGPIKPTTDGNARFLTRGHMGKLGRPASTVCRQTNYLHGCACAAVARGLAVQRAYRHGRCPRSAGCYRAHRGPSRSACSTTAVTPTLARFCVATYADLAVSNVRWPGEVLPLTAPRE